MTTEQREKLFNPMVEVLREQGLTWSQTEAASAQILELIEKQQADDSFAHPDDVAVNQFAAAMKAKLKHAREVKGLGGWNTSDCSAGFLSQRLVESMLKGDPVDVANFAMMLHQRDELITPPIAPINMETGSISNVS